MMLDFTIAYQTPEETERMTQLYEEMSHLTETGQDPKKREAELQGKDDELISIIRRAEKRYLDRITPGEALKDAQTILKELEFDDYQRNVDLCSSFRKTQPKNDFLHMMAAGGPDGAMFFINSQITLQRSKILGAKDSKLKKALADAVADKMNEWFPGSMIPIEELERMPSPLIAMPNGEPLFVASRMINATKKGRPPRPSTTNRHERLELPRKDIRDGTPVVCFVRTVIEREGTRSRIQVETSELILKKNKGFLKIFYYLLSEMTRRDFPPEVVIPIKWFVDIGMYSTVGNAKKALMLFKDQITDIRISGEIKRGQTIIKASSEVMFYKCEVGEGRVRILANAEFNWDFICGYFTVFPTFAFQLSENAFALICYICYLARQNADKATKEGLIFNINMKSIADYLGLPPVDAVKHRKYRDRIIEPIEKAIEEIERKTAVDPACQDGAFLLEPHVLENGSIHEWLKGYLQINLKGEFTKSFLDIAENADKKRATFQKAKVQEAARIAARKEEAAASKG